MAKACFTGHRTISEPIQSVRKRLNRCIIDAVNKYNITDYYVGGACGFDILAANEIINIQKKGVGIRLHIILPYDFEEFTVKWCIKDKKALAYQISIADSVEYISRVYYDGCIKIRNQALVNNADCMCICYYNPRDSRSGTGQTVRMAIKRGLIVKNIYNCGNQ